MQLYRFDQQVGKSVTHFDSQFIMTKILQLDGETQIGCMYLEPHGVIGYHEAKVAQLLLIVAGEGLVRSGSFNEVSVKVGDAVYWEVGEWHETTSSQGLTAIVIESEKMDPRKFLVEKS